ncbi:MAG: hypothetical protein AMXMBFR78_16400 [Rubrivivax sp.]
MAPAPHPLTPSLATHVRRLPAFAREALIVQLVCLLIGVLLWLLLFRGKLLATVVHSLLIGNGCWLSIDGGRVLVGRWRHRRGQAPTDAWPGWRWMAPITLVGTLIGYVGGNALAQALIGSSGQKLVISPFLLVVSLAAALAISYVFHARAYAQVLALKAEAAEHLAREAQLRVLQSQLEPHMLFNTLANLRALIGVDPPQAQAMLDHLIAFLRSTLAGTRVERHSLAAEFASLADYLALMQMRMGQRLAMRLDLPAELAGLPVPPLLLQPLVENAIRHGLEPRVEGGRVEVGARRVEGGLELRVRDTGVGLAPQAPRAAHAAHAAPAAQAAQMPRMPPMPHAAGTPFGLEQVRQRLQRLYGDAARLTLQPAADAEGGTLAQIILPILPLPS